MEQHEGKLESHAYRIWTKRTATEELTCWATHAIINKGDWYYECRVDITLYGMKMNMPIPALTETEYFKQKLKNFRGFKYI